MQALYLFPRLRTQCPYQGQERILEFFTAKKHWKKNKKCTSALLPGGIVEYVFIGKRKNQRGNGFESHVNIT